MPQTTEQPRIYRRLGAVALALLLCVVHLPSKLYQDETDQLAFTTTFCHTVLGSAEKEVGHNRTIVVGDLNMNPYETAVVGATAFHAVPTRAIASKERRTVKFESNLYFYNPMWRHFGEQAQGHAGTYYFARPKARADFWNMYDQVLLRADLLEYFPKEEVNVIHEDVVSGESLLRRSIPDNRISDHLPIVFRLDI